MNTRVCSRPTWSGERGRRASRVAQTFDLAGTLALGVPSSFAHFAKGWELECSHNGTDACRIDGIASRPCKERKDGAPTVV